LIPIPNHNEYKGTVEIHGSVDLKQFYYKGGKSDADTVKITIPMDSTRFRTDAGSSWKENLQALFNGAYVRSKDKPVVDNKNRISIRLQGIDAPELHYRATKSTKPHELTEDQNRLWMTNEFRQHWGARCAFELANYFSKYDDGSGVINAYVFSRVDSPSDLFDVYGRLVGDIVIGEDNQNVNHWLAENGWAFPAFYNSMTGDEINTINKKSKEALDTSQGIWNDYSNMLITFDPDLDLPSKKEGEIDKNTDNGGVNFPKIFRRQVPYEVSKKAGVINLPSLQDYLKTQKEDRCYIAKELLTNGEKAQSHKIAEFVDEDGKISFDPDGLIFTEKESGLKDSNGSEIDHWY
jgi:endonuclease YncB( thermonuclease family)